MKPRAKATATDRVHFACFDCRKSFKQPESSNWEKEIPERPFECPNCKRPMTRLGKYFRAPRKRMWKQWLKIELLYSFGETFDSSWTNISWKCGTLPETIEFLVDAGEEEAAVRQRLVEIRARRRENPSRK